MTKILIKEPRKRIYDAALFLFARRGFDAVGIREIAKAAKVNSAMINYYFGGKVGILKKMIRDCYDKYYCAIWIKDSEKMSAEARVRLTIDRLINFFRENTELAMVAFNAVPYDIPEVNDLKAQLVAERRRGTNEFFLGLGLDVNDLVKMSVLRGLLTSIVADHFQFRHTQEQIREGPLKGIYAKAPFVDESKLDFNDEYYKRYAETLTKLYLYGVTSIGTRKEKE